MSTKRKRQKTDLYQDTFLARYCPIFVTHLKCHFIVPKSTPPKQKKSAQKTKDQTKTQKEATQQKEGTLQMDNILHC
jgi:hypothetical protein